jgi:dihydrofolate reductase
VLTRSPGSSDQESLVYVSSLEDAFKHAAGRRKAFVIGGAQVYREALTEVDELWVTEIPGDYPGDVFFPQHPIGPDWKEYSKNRREEITFVRYRRL